MIFDYHIHTKYSSCCKQDYNYLDVWKKIQEFGLDGFGTSDHSNYKSYNASFVYEQFKMQKENHLENKGLVGLEISIISKKGTLGVDPKILRDIDYKIISEHVHIAKPFSGFFTFKAHFQKLMKNYPKNENKIKKEFDNLLKLELNGIKNHPKSILAHIFRFPVNHGYFFNFLYDRVDQILETLQASNVALELHSSYVGGIALTNDQAEEQKKGGDPESNRFTFYEYLTKRIKDYSLKFALGSDAHRLDNLKPKSEWQDFLQKINVHESQLVTPEFFRKD
jgi:histidinol phosphatase-like PHP family hydrolase